MRTELNEMQENFVLEYMKDYNATQAAKRAGYSERSAHQQGYKLLKHPEIHRRIQQTRDEMASKNIATIKEIEEFLSLAMHGKLDEQVVMTLGVGPGFTDIAKDRKEIELKDRIRAAELLGRRYGIFTDKHEHSGTVGMVNIIDDIPTGDDDDRNDG